MIDVIKNFPNIIESKFKNLCKTHDILFRDKLRILLPQINNQAFAEIYKIRYNIYQNKIQVYEIDYIITDSTCGKYSHCINDIERMFIDDTIAKQLEKLFNDFVKFLFNYNSIVL